jgi:hypothetical protein
VRSAGTGKTANGREEPKTVRFDVHRRTMGLGGTCGAWVCGNLARALGLGNIRKAVTRGKAAPNKTKTVQFGVHRCTVLGSADCGMTVRMVSAQRRRGSGVRGAILDLEFRI